MENKVALCSVMAYSFQYERICNIYLHYLQENNSVYVFSPELSGFPTKNVRDPRSQDIPKFSMSVMVIWHPL